MGNTVRFQLDCGATVNLIPHKLLTKALGSSVICRPPETELLMFDKTKLKTIGMITASITNPKTQQCRRMDFYVTDNHRQPILGSQACQQLQLLTVNAENILALGSRPAVLSMAYINEEYKDLFNGIGQLEGSLHIDIDPAIPPVRLPLRRLPIAIKDKVRSELEQLVKNGVITPEPEPTLWISALLVVTKPNGKIRICIDPKPLNRALHRNHYPMPTIEDVIPDLKNAKVFSTVDAKDAFWHVLLDEESSKLTTFQTPFGKFRWLRLPFGISVAPEEFQRRIHNALSGLDGIACIADDILVYGSGANVEEAAMDHDRKMLALLERCREKGIRLNQQKFKLRRKSIEFMGHCHIEHGLEADDEKLAAIDNMPPPVDVRGVQRLLGMATYLAKFVPNFSEVTAPLRSLLDKDAEFYWDTTVQGLALERFKSLLRSAPVLQFFDSKLPTRVQCDSSQNGLGACLLQNGRPVAYASRALTQTEQRYAQIEKENLAILFALEKFHTYVYERQVTVETDHKPLISIFKKTLTSAPRRLQRMLLRLQNYTFDLIFKPGTEVIVADTLSRAYPEKNNRLSPSENLTEDVATITGHSENSNEEIAVLVASDNIRKIVTRAAKHEPSYAALANQIRLGWPETPVHLSSDVKEFFPFCDELAIEDDLIFKGTRLFVPPSA